MRAYMNETVTLHTHVTDKWNQVQSTTNITIAAKINRNNVLVRDQNGEQVVSSTRLRIENRAITHEDTVTVDGVEHTILTIQQVRDFVPRYLQVFLK